jgi:nicotinamidase-related amidase
MSAPRGASRALLLIDFQQDFLDPQGRRPVCAEHVAPVLAAARRAVGKARAAGDAVAAVGSEFRPDDWLMNLLRRRASIAGSAGARWTDALPLDGVNYFPKWASSAFVNPGLERWLRAHDAGTLVLAGQYAKGSVKATCRDALRLGFVVEVAEEAVACASDASRARALRRMEKLGALVVA